MIRPSVLHLLDLSCPSRLGNRDPTLDIILQELKIDCWKEERTHNSVFLGEHDGKGGGQRHTARG